jgi:hypothetical protein
MPSDVGSVLRCFKRGMPSDEGSEFSFSLAGSSEIILTFEGTVIFDLEVVVAGVAEFCGSSETTLIFDETLISGLESVVGAFGSDCS